MIERNGLVLIVVLSSLFFGTVETWSLAVIGALTSLVFVFFILRMKDPGDLSSDLRGIVIAMAAIFAYSVFQLVPFPLSITDKLHPGIKELVAILPSTTPAYHSLSVYPFASEMESARQVIYLMVFSVAAFGINSRKDVDRIVKTLSVFGFALALFGIVQWATWNGKLYWFRELTRGGAPFGPFVNKNHFAGFINMVSLLSLGVALKSRSNEKKVMYAFFSVAMAIALFLSLSRGGIVSFFAGILVFSFVMVARTMSRRSLVRLVPLFLFILTLCVYLLFIGVSPAMERFAHAEASDQQRLAAWQGTVSAIKDSPIFGTGLGTFRHIFKLYQGEGLFKYWEHAHNDYLELLLEEGIIGVVIWSFFFFYMFKVVIGTESGNRGIYLKAGFFAAIAAVAVHSVVDFNLHIPSNAILFFALLGIAVSLSRCKKDNAKDAAGNKNISGIMGEELDRTNQIRREKIEVY